MSKNNAIYSPYGAFELKAKYQRNYLLATTATVSLIVLIVFTAWIIGVIRGSDGDNIPMTLITTVADLGPPPSIARKRPQIQVNQPKINMPQVGIPKPVADDELLDEDVVIASKEDLAEIVAPDITAGDGDIVVDIEDYIPDINAFVPVEIQPEIIYKHKPAYPRFAKQAGLEGKVVVKVLLNEEGNVLDAVVYVSSGTASLDDAAISAAAKCKFKPGIQNGRPVKVWVTYSVEFKLNGK